MNKTIFIILGIFICSATMAQSPCDAKLSDQVKAKLDHNELYLKGFITSAVNGSKAQSTYTLLLNANISYGFTIGNSTTSERDITFTVSDNCGNIEEKTVSPGQFDQIVFNCKALNVYHITVTSDQPGKVCAIAIMSYRETINPDQP